MPNRRLRASCWLALALTLATGCGSSSGGGNPPDSGTPIGGGAGGVKRVFITSMTYSGDLGGVAGGDAKCQAVADAATAAGLGDFAGATWKAWLSSSTVPAIDHIADVGPWYRVDKTTRVFNNKAQISLVPAQLLAAIGTDERGNTLSDRGMWTGTAPGGQSSGNTCADWSTDVCSAYYVWSPTGGFGNYYDPVVIRSSTSDGSTTLGFVITSGSRTGCTEPTWPTTPGVEVTEPGCPAWTASTTYPAYSYVDPVVRNGHRYKGSAGTSGTTEPAWPTDGGTVVDGTITWEDEGPYYSYVSANLAKGTVGDSSATDDGWTSCQYPSECPYPDSQGVCCNAPLPLICFEQ